MNKHMKNYRCDICGKQYATKSNLNRHSNVHNGLIYTCQYCSKQCSDRTNLNRHEINCSKYNYGTSVSIEEDKHAPKLVLRLSNKPVELTLPDVRVDQLVEKIDQLVETNKVLATDIKELKNRQTTTTAPTSPTMNTTINVSGNVNVVNNNIRFYLNDNDIDLYEIKKKLIGPEAAYRYVMGLLDALPCEKFDWLLDETIFEKPENIPIRVVNLKESKIIIHDKLNSTVQDNGTHLNKMCGRIVGHSASRAMTQQLELIIQQNDEDIQRRELDEQHQDQIDDQIDDRLGLLYNGVLKNNVSSKLLNLERPVNRKHLREILSRLSTIDVPI